MINMLLASRKINSKTKGIYRYTFTYCNVLFCIKHLYLSLTKKKNENTAFCVYNFIDSYYDDFFFAFFITNVEKDNSVEHCLVKPSSDFLQSSKISGTQLVIYDYLTCIDPHAKTSIFS